MAWLIRASNVILLIEKRVVTAMAALLLLLILLNIVTRELQAALFWVDELAIYTMIWMALVGASAMVRMRAGVAVTLVTDLLPAAIQRVIARLVDLLLLGFALVLAVLCWLWYDPVALAASGFDFDVFAGNTFKFIYSEPTNTIGIRKFWIWLILPAASVTMSIHALANLVEGVPVAAGKSEDAGGLSV